MKQKIYYFIYKLFLRLNARLILLEDKVKDIQRYWFNKYYETLDEEEY